MYESFFGLKSKPFTILPDPNAIYWGRPHSLAYAMLEFGVMNSAGFTVITGEIGSGKTTLLRHLLKSLPDTVTPGLISNTPQGRQELLQWILMALNQPFDGSYPVLFKQLTDHLHAQFARGQRTLLIIDEAQNLEPEALEHLRMIANINVDDQQILQLILVGQPQLRETLARPELRQLAQRISSDFHIQALTEPEVVQYIDFRVRTASVSPAPEPLFSREACARIAQASGGIPRLINILCDTALVYSFAASKKQVSAAMVEQVIEDKRQIGISPVMVGAAIRSSMDPANEVLAEDEEE
ncbi:MAG: AAA family ATPase [Burkholderiaceae bacterium]|jgi:type II secretory pathway predicted ATPase ExeA|nr:AAA family ATPase [Burkholderiaceae bacterium]